MRTIQYNLVSCVINREVFGLQLRLMSIAQSMTTSVSLCPLHTRRDLIGSCEKLLKSIWPHAKAERLQRLENEECSGLPCSLVLIEHQDNAPDSVIGHVRLVPVTCPNPPKGIYLESLCIDKSRQGSGLGKKTLLLAEYYAEENLGCQQAFLYCIKSDEPFYNKQSYREVSCLSFETLGVNLLGSYDGACSWYGNAPQPGWEFAYEGHISTKDEMAQKLFRIAMQKVFNN